MLFDLMHRPFRLALFFMLCPCVAAPVAAQERERALSVAREVERLATARTFWPGFDPLAIPLAVFTGQQTWLFRHASPPEGFRPLPGAPRVFVFDGRHPAVTSNSSAVIGGVVTATVLADGARASQTANALAATALHEAFHVFQRDRHKGWSGNEGSVFTWPTDDARILMLRRLESAALGRAVSAESVKASACWSRTMLELRRERFEVTDTAYTTYERLTELNEGLAAYVQLLAGGATTVTIPSAEFKPGRFRERIYVTGPALAFVLDRVRPRWQEALEANDGLFLDQLLETALPRSDAPPCVLPAHEVAAIDASVRRDAEEVHRLRTARRQALDSRPGWRVVIHAAEGQPLWPQGFDPLNVEAIEGGFLHSRFLRLGNDAGSLQAIDEAGVDLEAMTEGVGPHPLFNGIRRVIIAGIAKPETRTEGTAIELWTAGFTARFTNASLTTTGTTMTVHVASRR